MMVLTVSIARLLADLGVYDYSWNVSIVAHYVLDSLYNNKKVLPKYTVVMDNKIIVDGNSALVSPEHNYDTIEALLDELAEYQYD